MSFFYTIINILLTTSSDELLLSVTRFCIGSCLLNVLVVNELSERQKHSQPIIYEHQQSKVMFTSHDLKTGTFHCQDLAGNVQKPGLISSQPIRIIDLKTSV